VTSVAAMQLVEQGRLQLDQPVGNILPELSAPQVLEGFDDAGAPRLRPARRPITLRHLLTHTAGFAYPVWDEALGRYIKYRAHHPGIPASSPRCVCHWSSTRETAGSTGSISIGPGE
jgi:methyl acetate hydrolase